MMCLGACTDGKIHSRLYSDDDLKVQIALREAKANYPAYFDALEKTDSTEHFIAKQVFGRDVECVAFENASSIIIDIDLPLYCFRKGSDELVHRL